jgi:malate dehydrogenase (oxaloacetate-decarboxylating)
MFMAGIQALANLAPALHDPNASLLPDLSDVREVSVHVAAAIVRQACKEGRTRDETVLKVVNGELGEGLEEFIRGSMWDPVSTMACWCCGSLAHFIFEPLPRRSTVLWN